MALWRGREVVVHPPCCPGHLDCPCGRRHGDHIYSTIELTQAVRFATQPVYNIQLSHRVSFASIPVRNVQHPWFIGIYIYIKCFYVYIL